MSWHARRRLRPGRAGGAGPAVPAAQHPGGHHHAGGRRRPRPRRAQRRPPRPRPRCWPGRSGCSLAALAGILLAPLQTLTHLPLTLLIVNAYAAAMIGRLRNLPLTFLGAALLGLLDSYAFTYLPDDGSLEPWVRSLAAGDPGARAVRRARRPAQRPGSGPAPACGASPPRPTWIGALVLAGCVAGGGPRDGRRVLRRRRPAGPARPSRLGIIALSLVPLVGWAGQMCLCQMSFAAIGAICVGHLGGGGNPWALLAGGRRRRSSASSSPCRRPASRASSWPWRPPRSP